MPFVIPVIFLLLGVGIGWGVCEVHKDNTEPTSADEKNFKRFRQFMDECKETELTEIWAKTKKP